MILAILATGCRNPDMPMDAPSHGSGGANDAKAMFADQTVDVQPAPVRLFFQAVTACGMREVLQSPGPLTIFAPTDSALASMPRGQLDSLMQPQNRDKLQEFVACHVFSGAYLSKDLLALKDIQTRDGRRLAISTDDRGLRIGNAHIIESDIICSNGIIHIVDSVLTP
jgi:uncharacterized surface protein with fasciclin (FAS1) repeats